MVSLSYLAKATLRSPIQPMLVTVLVQLSWLGHIIFQDLNSHAGDSQEAWMGKEARRRREVFNAEELLKKGLSL